MNPGDKTTSEPLVILTINPTDAAMSAAQNESAAWPKAEDPALVQELLDCVQQASHYRQLKKGAVSRTTSYFMGPKTFG